jgi:phosphotransferase system HPr (HPr) family protein
VALPDLSIPILKPQKRSRGEKMAVSQEVTIQNKLGLHARPAALFIKTAATFASQITIENKSKGSKTVNAKSIISVMSAAVKKDDRILITVEGSDEEAALEALVALIHDKFGEAE